MAYSLDLRTRIVNAVERNDKPKREVAKLFGVHESFIYKLLRQKRDRGDIAPLPHDGGADAKLKEQHLLILSDLAAKSPDATLDELREQMKKQARVLASVTTIWRGMDTLDLSLKKKSIRATEADPIERAKLEEKQKKLPVENLVFIDEFGINTAMTRTHARSPRAERAEVSEPFNYGKNTSVISSISLAGVGATMSIEALLTRMSSMPLLKTSLSRLCSRMTSCCSTT